LKELIEGGFGLCAPDLRAAIELGGEYPARQAQL